MPISHISAETHRKIVDDVRQQKDALRQQLEELEAVERFHAKLAGMNGTAVETQQLQPATVLAAEVHVPKNATKHDAAALALRSIGRPAKIGEIADFLVDRGYGVELSRRIFFNGIYTALKRRTDLFKPAGDACWALQQTARDQVSTNV